MNEQWLTRLHTTQDMIGEREKMYNCLHVKFFKHQVYNFHMKVYHEINSNIWITIENCMSILPFSNQVVMVANRKDQNAWAGPLMCMGWQGPTRSPWTKNGILLRGGQGDLAHLAVGGGANAGTAKVKVINPFCGKLLKNKMLSIPVGICSTTS